MTPDPDIKECPHLPYLITINSCASIQHACREEMTRYLIKMVETLSNIETLLQQIIKEKSDGTKQSKA